MQALLWILGLSAACLAPISANILVQPDFNYEQMAGGWHPLAMVSTATTLSALEKKLLWIDSRVTALEGGQLQLVRNVPLPEGCKAFSVVFSPWGWNGIYTTPSGSIIHFMDVDYENYLIMRVMTRKHTGMYLSARALYVGDDVKERFKELVEDQGFEGEMITYFKRAEQCTP